MGQARELIIDHSVLFTLINSDAFYRSLPAGNEDVEDAGRAAYRNALKAALGQGECGTCTSLGGHLRPFQKLLGERLAALKAQDPELLRPLADFIASKRGSRPKAIVFYYAKGVEPLRF